MPSQAATSDGAIARRAVLAGLAACLPGAARAQSPPQVTPQSVPATPPVVPAPAATTPPRPVTPPASIDRTKAYYLFFQQQIDANSMKALQRQLAALVEAGVPEITLVIDSPGGQIDPMLAAYSFVRALPIRIRTHAQSFVQSAATVLFLAGQERTADRTARFLFHPASASILGALTEQQVHERLNLADTVESVIGAIYQERTRLTEQQVKLFAREEVIFTAEQAQQAGIVDAIADLKLPDPATMRLLFLD